MEKTKAEILIIDDNEINAMIVQSIINSFGLEADMADSGNTAIEAAQQKHYSLILMDHIMPDIDGVEATTQIRTFCDSPIIALSANLDDEIINQFKKAGAQGGIKKPVDPEELCKLIEHYVEGAFNVEKLAESEEDIDNDEERSRLKQALENVNGLSFDVGLKISLDNVNNYHRVIKASVRNIRKYSDLIDNYLDEGITDGLKLAFHSLRSVFANLGIQILSAEAGWFENSLLDITAGADYKDRINKFKNKIVTTGEELKEASEIYDSFLVTGEVTEPEQPVSAREMAEIIVNTQEAVSKYEIFKILDGLERLKLATCRNDRKKIENAIEAAQMFDYDTVRRLITEFSSIKLSRGEAR